MRPLLRSHQQFGAYEMLVSELCGSDEQLYTEFTRVSPEDLTFCLPPSHHMRQDHRFSSFCTTFRFAAHEMIFCYFFYWRPLTSYLIVGFYTLTFTQLSSSAILSVWSALLYSVKLPSHRQRSFCDRDQQSNLTIAQLGHFEVGQHVSDSGRHYDYASGKSLWLGATTFPHEYFQTRTIIC